MNTQSRSFLSAFEARMRRFLRVVFFENLGISLGVSFGLAQTVLAYWWLAVILQRPAPSLALFALTAALSVAFNLAVVFSFGTVRSRRIRARNVGSAYAAVGFSLTVIAAVVVCGGFGFIGLGALLGLSGGGPQSAFEAFRATSAALASITGVALLSGFFGGRRRTRIVPVRVSIPNLPADARGLRIAHLSDLHIGNGVEGRRLDRIVQQTNAIGADIIVITGDIFDRDQSVIPEGAGGLGKLRAKLGIFAVLGNHDDYTGYDAVVQGLSRYAPSIRLLRCDWVRLPTGAPLYLAGLDDPGHDWTIEGTRTASIDALARTLPSDGPTLLLVHRPDAFPRAVSLGFPLVLAGHYHGGQVAVPGTRGRLNPARLLTEYDGGLYRHGGSTLFVSKGIGTTGPRIRLACPPEIAIIEIDR